MTQSRCLHIRAITRAYWYWQALHAMDIMLAVVRLVFKGCMLGLVVGVLVLALTSGPFIVTMLMLP